MHAGPNKIGGLQPYEYTGFNAFTFWLKKCYLRTNGRMWAPDCPFRCLDEYLHVSISYTFEDYELCIMDCVLWTVDFELWYVDWKLCILNYELWVLDCDLEIVIVILDFGLWLLKSSLHWLAGHSHWSGWIVCLSTIRPANPSLMMIPTILDCLLVHHPRNPSICTPQQCCHLLFAIYHWFASNFSFLHFDALFRGRQIRLPTSSLQNR